MRLYKQRKHVFVPERITTSTWAKMTLSQQYEAVFGPLDPSRRKLLELPYFISILSRRNHTLDKSKCVYCQRDQCTNCPLPFEEMTLREYLNKAGVSTQSYFYYEDHLQKLLIINQNKVEKKKAGQFNAVTPNKKQQPNLEFEL